MEKEDKIILWIILIFTIITIIGLAFTKTNNHKKETIEIIDTTYNTITLDSIKYNIIVRDSIIYHIRHDYEDSITVVVNLDDSSSVVLFKQLTRERD